MIFSSNLNNFLISDFLFWNKKKNQKFLDFLIWPFFQPEEKIFPIIFFKPLLLQFFCCWHFKFRSEFLRCFSFFKNLWFLEEDSSTIFDIFLKNPYVENQLFLETQKPKKLRHKSACAKVPFHKWTCGFLYLYESFINFVFNFKHKNEWKQSKLLQKYFI